MSKIPVFIGMKATSLPSLPAELSESTSSTSPRPGGYVKSLSKSLDERTSRAPRSKNIKETLKQKQFQITKSRHKIVECDDMLAVTISCVMMMASNAEEIPDEYFVWTEHYLSKIKDENGEYPPNVKGILNHMALIRPHLPSPETVGCRCGVYQGIVDSENSPCDMCSHDEPRLPERYIPIPYTFRLPNDSKIAFTGRSRAKCPPFYVQLDHTLACVWSLFSEEQTIKPLGVAQIQWALSFLKGITNSKKEHPQDVLICIDAMQEALITQYADMAESVLSVMPTQTVSEPIVETATSVTSDNVPFSVNYFDMMKYKDTPSERTLRPNESPSEINEKIQNLTGNAAQNLQTKEEMLAFLQDFRREQITKVCDELKRLQSIEAYLGSMDRCNFKPYLDNQDIADLFKGCDCKK